MVCESRVLRFGRPLVGLLLGLSLSLASGGLAVAKDSAIIGLQVEPPGLDPTIAAPTAIREVTWNNIFEGLTTLDKDGKVQPLLAKSWSVSSDGLTYTFHLRQGVAFSNGTPFDSAIVKFSFDRARAADSTNAQKQIFTPIDHVDTPDPLTAVVVLKHAFGNFLYFLAWGDAIMVDPKTASANKTDPVGTGPFLLKQWARGDRVELVRNPHYWQAGLPKLNAVTFRFIGDPQAEVAALRAGDIDAFPNFAAAELFGEFQKDPKFKTTVGVTPRKLVAGFNNGVKPMSDVRVRQALMSAIDRKTLIEGANSGFGTPIGSHYAPSDAGYVDLTGVFPYDPEKARQLLRIAGYPNGFSFTMKTPQFAETVRAAQVIQSMLAEVGVTMTIAPSEFPAKWIDEVFKRKDFEATIIDHAEPMDIDIYSRPGYYFNYANPAFNTVVAKALAEADDARRMNDLAAAQTILANDVPALYLFDLPRLGVFAAKLDGLWANEPLPQMLMRDANWAQ